MWAAVGAMEAELLKSSYASSVMRELKTKLINLARHRRAVHPPSATLEHLLARLCQSRWRDKDADEDENESEHEDEDDECLLVAEESG